jgi:hypothetical protein
VASSSCFPAGNFFFLGGEGFSELKIALKEGEQQ